jgi:hypothetical protein
MEVLEKKQNNTKSIHTGGGSIKPVIEFYINGQLIKRLEYRSVKERQKFIDSFKWLYPANANHQCSFIIKPHWELWHSREPLELSEERS